MGKSDLRWEISEKGAEQLNDLSRRLSTCCQELEMENIKLGLITQENPQLGPHKDNIDECIKTVMYVSKSCKEDIDELCKKINKAADAIRELVSEARGLKIEKK